LLANIYLNKLDRIWAARCAQLGIMVRFADDFVAMCRTESAAREALRRIGLVMERLGLTLHPAKTRLVDLRRRKEGFVFLGCMIRRRNSGKDVKQIIAELTPVLRGWANYFRTGNADREFNKMDSFVFTRLRPWHHRRGGQRAAKRGPFTGDQLYGMGLHRLMGTVKYPA
jgi:hypothetical protein